MGFGSPIHWIVLMLVVVLLFGSGRISGLMGDVAKGIKSFKKGMAEDDDLRVTPPPVVQPQARIDALDVPRSQAERDLAAFEAHVATIPEVRECHMLNGEIDFILKIVAADLKPMKDDRPVA